MFGGEVRVLEDRGGSSPPPPFLTEVTCVQAVTTSSLWESRKECMNDDKQTAVDKNRYMVSQRIAI